MLTISRAGFRVLFLILICLLLVSSADVSLLKAQSQTNQCVQIDSVEGARQFDVDRGMFLPKTNEIFLPYSTFGHYSPDGNYVIFVGKDNHVYLGSLKTRKVTLIVLHPQEWGMEQFPLYWSSDSHYVAFFRPQENSNFYTLVVLEVDSGKEHEFDKTGFIGFSADSMYFAISIGERNDDSDFFKHSVWSTTKMEAVAQIDQGKYSYGEWSPAGHKLVFLSDKGDLIIWSLENGIELRSSYPHLIELAEAIGRPEHNDARFSWSPDGEYVTFSGGFDIPYTTTRLKADFTLYEFFRVSDGKIIDILVEQKDQLFINWSKDNWLMLLDFDEEKGEQKSAIASLNVATGERRIISDRKDGSDLMYFNLSPGKNYMTYVTRKEGETGQPDVYEVVVYDIEAETQQVVYQTDVDSPAIPDEITTFHGNMFWSPDENFLATQWQHKSDTEVTTYLVVTDRSGRGQQIITLTRELFWAWIDDNWLYFVKPDKDRYSHELINIQTGKTKPITTTSKAPDYYNLDSVILAPNGHNAALILENKLYIVPLGSTVHKTPNLYPRTHRFSWSDTHNFIGLHYSLAWSPDSSMVAYIDDTDLVIVTSGGKELHRAPLEQTDVGDLSWVPCQN